MIVGRTLAAVTALIVLATATTIAVVAAAFALYFVLEPLLGKAGACAILAGVFALVVAVAVLVAASKTGGNHHSHHSAHAPQHDFGLIERVMDMVKDKPILSIGAAVAAGLIAIRNPALVATIVAAFMQPKRDD